jgi:SAM-dependent methyltransferase
MKKETQANRALWDVWTRLHLHSEFYGADAFRAGKKSLTWLEQEEIGFVRGKSLLHLQCHFGQDTLSWARLGAEVTGIDFSLESITQARLMAEQLNLPARFLCADLESGSLPIDETFDIIYTSFGVLSWLSQLRPWAQIIAKHLAKGGFFYIIEFHPVFGMLDDEGEAFKYSYFSNVEPIISSETSSYSGISHPPLLCYQWNHSLSDVVTALTEAGLRVIFLHEFPYCLHNCYPFLSESSPGKYVVAKYPGLLPLLFSIKASH